MSQTLRFNWRKCVYPPLPPAIAFRVSGGYATSAGGFQQLADGSGAVVWQTGATTRGTGLLSTYSAVADQWTTPYAFAAASNPAGFTPPYKTQVAYWDQTTSTYRIVTAAGLDFGLSGECVNFNSTAFPGPLGEPYNSNGALPRLMTDPAWPGRAFFSLTSFISVPSLICALDYRGGRPALTAVIECTDGVLPNHLDMQGSYAGNVDGNNWNYLPARGLKDGSATADYFSPAVQFNVATFIPKSVPVPAYSWQQPDGSYLTAGTCATSILGEAYVVAPTAFASTVQALVNASDRGVAGWGEYALPIMSGTQLVAVEHVPFSLGASEGFGIPVTIPVPSDFTTSADWAIFSINGVPYIMDNAVFYAMEIIISNLQVNNLENWCRTVIQ